MLGATAVQHIQGKLSDQIWSFFFFFLKIKASFFFQKRKKTSCVSLKVITKMHHLEGPLLGLEALFSLPFLSSCIYLSVKCLWLLHCWSSAAVRQWELSSARGPRNTLRIQQGGQEIATPHRLSFPFGRPDQANVPYLCQQRAGDLRFCHSRRWFGMQAGQTPPQQLPLCSRDRAGRSAAPAGIPKGSQTTTYGSWSFHFSCKLLPAGKTVFLKMGRCTMHSPASSPPPPHPRNKKGSTEFAGSHFWI